MIDNHHLVYAGTLAVFLAIVLVIAVTGLLVLTAVVVTVSVVQARRKGKVRGSSVTGRVAAAAWPRHEPGAEGLSERAGRLPKLRPAATPWPTDDDLHAVRGPVITASEAGGRHWRSVTSRQVPPVPPRRTHRLKNVGRKRLTSRLRRRDAVE